MGYFYAKDELFVQLKVYVRVGETFFSLLRSNVNVRVIRMNRM